MTFQSLHANARTQLIRQHPAAVFRHNDRTPSMQKQHSIYINKPSSLFYTMFSSIEQNINTSTHNNHHPPIFPWKLFLAYNHLCRCPPFNIISPTETSCLLTASFLTSFLTPHQHCCTCTLMKNYMYVECRITK